MPVWGMQVLRGRWFALLSACLVMAASGGGVYVFPVYSNAAKASLRYDHKTLSRLALFKNLGASLGIIPGLINEVAQAWVVLAFGAAMNLVGYLVMYLGVSGRTARPSPWLMYLYMFVAANSQSFATTGALASTVHNFPGDRGLVLGLLTGFSGLSGAIFTQLHRGFYGAGADGAPLLLLLAWMPTAILLLSTFTIRIITTPRPRPASVERKGILAFLGVSFFVGLCLIALSVVEVIKVPGFGLPASRVTTIFLLFILVVSLVLIAVNQEYRINMMHTAPPTASSAPAGEAPALRVSVAPSSYFFQDVFRPPARGQDYTIMQALCSVDMALLLVATACGTGGMLTAIDNMGLIGQALGYKQGAISLLVSLLSMSNYAGRAVAGLGSEYVVSRYKQPRPVPLAVTLLLAFVGHLLVAHGVRNGLYAASLIIGFCLGAHWTLVMATISEVFGLGHFSALSNLVALASPVGYYVLDVVITGHHYAREAQRQNDLTCIGARCFMSSFHIIAGATLLGAAVSAVLAWRTKEFYRALLSVVAAVTSSGELEMERTHSP